MKRLTCEDIITGILLLLVLIGASLVSPPVPATPIYLKWKNSEGVQEENFELGNPEGRAKFLKTFKTNPRIRECSSIADYAVELMGERDEGTSEGFHLEVMRVNYENTQDDPEGLVPWHVYVDFQRMVRDLHRNSNGQFFFTDPNKHWEREFRWCFINAANWPAEW